MDLKQSRYNDEDYYNMHMHSNSLGLSYYISMHNDLMEREVKVVKGKKVPIGTVGKVFWMTAKSYDFVSTTVIVGIKDEEEKVYFTNANNVERIRGEEDKK
jgi:rRNA processing protein Gar1